MVKCELCSKEMTSKKTTSCVDGKIMIGGIEYDPVPYEDDEGRRCHDCNIAPGGIHHPGCDWEKCPKCGMQLISCDCMGDDAETC